MHNVILSELMKIQKNKMAWIGTLVIVGIPLLLMMKSLFIDQDRGPYMEWLSTVLLLNTLILPIMSGFVVTSLIQKEYQDKTLRNVLSAPVARQDFIIAKLSIWFLWHCVSCLAAVIAVAIGFRVLFSWEFTADSLKYTLYLLTQNSLFSFLAALPLLWVAVRQQAMFYPAILAALVFAVLQASGRQISEDLILPASICPWTAVSVSNMTGFGSAYFILCTISVMLCGAVGAIGAVLSFKKQDQ